MIPSLSLTYFAGLSYPALVLAGIIAQPYASLACGSLAAAGVFSVAEVFAIFFVTDIVMDCIWYVLGMRHGERALAFIRRITRASEEDMARLPRAFHDHPARILITAKLLGGFGMMPLILFTAGAAKLPFGRYIALNAFGEIFWTGGFLALGYFFGSYVLQINGVFEKISAGALVIALLALFYWVGRQVYRRIIL